MEQKTVYRKFWVWDFEKEERWLNEMAASGWVLERVGFCVYHFVRQPQDSYTIRLELHSPDPAYLDFMSETGAEYIGRMVQWVYFRKRAENGVFELFSDLPSRIAHLRRISKMLAPIGFANFLIGICNSFHPLHIGWVNLLGATLLMYALGRIHGKIEALEYAQTLYE